MKVLDKLQRRFGRFAVPYLTEGLIACQVLTYVMSMGRPQFLLGIQLVPRRVLEGEVWRLVTFVCQPPLGGGDLGNAIFAIFFWYMFYLMGTALEGTWGTFRYNVYLLAGYIATVAVSFLQPNATASMGFLQGSIFLAFAYLYPDFVILLFFLIPVKIKWLALLAWISCGYVMLFGDWWSRLLVGASVFNFFLFFWHDIYLRMRSGQRRMVVEAARIKTAKIPRHTCAICGVNSLDAPKMTFRYCSKCLGGACYCAEHIHDHPHLVDGDQR